MKLRATLRAPRIDLEKYRRELQAHLIEQTAMAAFKWLSAVSAKVPVWSGASRATFLHLANAISLQLSISPVVRHRIPLGLAESEGSFNVKGGRVSFTYQTTLRHLIYNEFHNANVEWGFHLIQPGPYHFQEAGRRVFGQEAEHVRLLNPFKQLEIKTTRVS